VGDCASGGHAVEKLDHQLRIGGAARFLGVSQNTMRARATEGETPVGISPANDYRFFRMEVCIDSWTVSSRRLCSREKFGHDWESQGARTSY
jgi:hypothetical protein